jgi:HAD superfamily hydrolase (TIGR01509 family)
MLQVANLKAVIFDMDGLLLDSERVALSMFVDTCREFGFDPDVEVYYKCIGGNASRTKAIMIEGYGERFPFDAVEQAWHSRYEDLAMSDPLPVKVGVFDLLDYLEALGLKKAVVTSTARASALRKISNTGLAKYFDLVVGGDEISKSKPDPEIYLTACRRLGENPRNCLALEDSDNGVRSAHAAGMPVIQVPDLLQPSDEVRALGHEIVASLGEVKRLLEQGMSDKGRLQ